MKIRGRNAVVTGASSGIGRAVARALARRGANVVLVARRTEELTNLAAELKACGTRISAVTCDVTDADAVACAAAAIVSEFGPPDILVNAAGFGVWKPFEDTTEAEHRRMMDVNYWGTFSWIRAALPHMRRQGRGRIVNISSGSGKFALAVTGGYSASKFAVTGLSEALHRELLGSRVGVSCIHPGSVRTAFWDEARIPSKGVPPLVRFSPKSSPSAVARTVCACIWFGFPVRTTPVFVNVLAKANAIWIRLGDLMLWKWFVPAALALLLLRVLQRSLNFGF